MGVPGKRDHLTDVALAERHRRQAEAKAKWRDEALRAHLARPIEERLRAALALIIPRSRREHP